MILDAQVAGRSARLEVHEEADGRYQVTVDDQSFAVDFRDVGRGFASLIVDGQSHEAGFERLPGGFRVSLAGATYDVELLSGVAGAPAHGRVATGPARLTAPMPGKIVRVLVAPGAQVEAGQGLVVMEAMKMENELRAPRPGQVREVAVREGQAVETGALLALIE